MNKNITVRGISASSILGIAFVVLRLCDVIHWQWVWVLSPFWIPWVLVIVLLLFIWWRTK